MDDCKLCHGLDIDSAFFRREGLRYTRQTFLYTVSEIAESARNGCGKCEMLATGIRICGGSETGKAHIIFETGLPLRFEPPDIEFYVHPGDSSPGSCVGEAAEIAEVITAELAAGLATRWLTKCQKEHALCSGSELGPPPTRLIDVGQRNGMSDPCLIETAETAMPSGASYIALSYCWGSNDNFTTTKESLGERKKGFSFEELPKTFQDAILVARCLGIRYLWVDALCIIQDDPSDWEAESSRMGDVYGGALLTISATNASTVSQGFLGQRTLPFAQHSGRKIQCSNAAVRHVFARRRIPHGWIVPEDGRTDGCPLLKRAWTFQERLLASRTLHFLPHELLWECRCHFWCECMSVRDDIRWKPLDMQGSAYNIAMSNPSKTNLPQLWHTLVQDFSKRQLTIASDRLPALSGIARKFQALGLKPYVAGMWGTNLFWDLLWHADQDADWHSDLQSLPANPTELWPSWSWVSCSRPVCWSDQVSSANRFPRMINDISGWDIRGPPGTDSYIVRADTVLAGSDSMGQVISGTLFMRARVTVARIGQNGLVKSDRWDSEYVSLIEDFPVRKRLGNGDPVWCVYMISCNKERGWVTQSWTAIAVLPVNHAITPIQGQNILDTPEYYYRIGLVKGKSSSHNQKLDDSDSLITGLNVPRWFRGIEPRLIAII